MGAAELDLVQKAVVIHSNIITYGSGSAEELTERIRDEIETLWNEAQGRIVLENESYLVQFRITAETKSDVSELEVLQNTNPHNNYFRIGDFVHGSISFVDGCGCNSGYFLTENLYKGSTTAAHEYGHTLGLDHPKILDVRGQGVPGIMYPRGTLVDAQYQYDPSVSAGLKGGTMHPMYRRVKQEDIEALKLHRLYFANGKAVVGAFSNVYHWNHAEVPPEGPPFPSFFG